MPRQENPDPQHIGDTMTDEKMKQLEARIEELETKCEELEAELDEINGDITNNQRLARAVCELQEELRRKFPDLYLINTINAPTMVGMK
jgi:uncharacterized coiled-coil protein SlyX